MLIHQICFQGESARECDHVEDCQCAQPAAAELRGNDRSTHNFSRIENRDQIVQKCGHRYTPASKL